MKKFKELAEQKGLMVMAFGRMNPPTIGHLKLCDKVKSIAGSKPYRIYLSQTVGPKDPLPFPKKIAYAKKSFPKHARAIQVDKSIKTFIQAAQKINHEGYTELVMVAGSDRIQEFQRLLDTYNGKPDKKGNIVFDFPDGVKVVSSGERDPDSADPTEAISASVMRAAAQSGDFETFKNGSPMKEPDAKKMYMDVRKAMGVREVNEDIDIRDDHDALRDLFVTGQIWNAGDMVEARGITGEVVRKGTNHLSFVDEDGKIHKAWLHEIEINETPISKLIGKVDAITHPKKYKSAMKKYASLMAKDRAKRMTTGALAHDAAREYNIDSKSLIDYINGLVKKGELPKALRASYMPTFVEASKTRQDKDIKDREGTQPSKYYAGIGKGTKDDRARHFEKGAKKSDDDPSAYKPAPGDATAKTKLSKHTKKVRKMYPDLYDEERNYKKEYENYHSKPEQIERRSSRNKARRAMGDKAIKGMDVGHKDNNPLNNDPDNLRNENPSTNRREPRLRENYLLEEVDIGNWKYEGPKEFAMKLMDKFGPPDYVEKNPETNEGYAVVFKNIDGFDFVRIVDSNTNKLHPYPAKIYVEGGLYFKVPHEMVGKLKLASPTIMIDELNGWVVGKCASLTIAAATLQFVIDAVNGDAPPTREEYDKRIKKIIEDGKVFPEITWWNNELKESKAPDTSDAMKRYKAGKAGFTDIAHLKAKGLIPRSDGEKRKSDKYKDESLWANIHKKRQRIKQGSGEKMRKKGEKGGPTPAQMQRAKSEEACCDDCGTDSTLIENNLYRVGSEAYYTYFEDMREKYENGELEVSGFDKELMEGDIGKFAIYEGEVVPLECPLVEAKYQGKDVALNEPKAGGPKKYYVYVRDPSTGNVKKVSWGDTTGLKIKLDDKEARKSFAARHKCDQQKDKTKAGYWACNMPRYADKLGLSGGGNFFW